MLERSPVAIATCSAALLFPLQARAQTPDSTPVVEIPEVRVEVTRLSIGGIDAARVPFFSTIRSRGEIRSSSALTLADALVRLTGVHMNDELGAAYQPDLTFGGFSVSPVVGLPQGLSVFVDGVRINEPDAAQVHFDLIPLEDVERIELIRGPAGPFGRNTLGGALNIVTRRGGTNAQAEVDAGGGSFGRLQASGRIMGALGPLDYYASGRYHQSDGWRDFTAARVVQFYGKLGYSDGLNDAWVSYQLARDSIEQAGSLPQSWLTGSLPPEFSGVDDPRTINFTGGDYFLPLLHFITGSYARQLATDLVVQGIAFYRSNDIEQFNANITEADTRGRSNLWSTGVTGQIAYHPRPSISLTAGVEYVRDDVEARIFAEANQASSESGLTTHVTADQSVFGAFTQAWWSPIPRASLTGSLRYDRVRIPFRDLLDPSNNGTNTFGQVTGSFGVDYFLTERLSLFASYGHGFRAPVILELACADPEDPCPLPFELGADPPLDPVTADTWQAGARLLWGRGALEVVGHYSNVHDDIFNVTVPPTTRGFFQNLELTRRKGLDLRGEYLLHRYLTLSGDLSLSRATFETAATLAAPFLDGDGDGGGAADGQGPDLEPPSVRPGDEFPLVPDVRAGLAIAFNDGRWQLALEGSYLGSQWLRGDEDNRFEEAKLDPYLLIDAYGERAIGALSVYLRVENILDTAYETFGVLALNPKGPGDVRVEPFLTPGFPRRLTAGASWRW